MNADNHKGRVKTIYLPGACGVKTAYTSDGGKDYAVGGASLSQDVEFLMTILS
jgi:hypothetical protein